MSRRSPRLLCPLLQLGYDNIGEGLVPCLTIVEALALMQTCRSMYISVFRALIDARLFLLRSWHSNLQDLIDSNEYLQIDVNMHMKDSLQAATDSTFNQVKAFKGFHDKITSFFMNNTHSAYLYTASRDNRWNRILEMHCVTEIFVDTDRLLKKIEITYNMFEEAERNWVPASQEEREKVKAMIRANEAA